MNNTYGVFVAIIVVLLAALAAQHFLLAGASAPQGKEVTAYMCPEDECAQKLIALFSGADSSVHVMIYSFTHKGIADSLIIANNRGIDVRVLADSGQAKNQYSKTGYLRENGVEVKEIEIHGYAIFHHKAAIVDGEMVSTGSFNYTQNADTGSAENLVFITSSQVAEEFEAEFERYWSAG